MDSESGTSTGGPGLAAISAPSTHTNLCRQYQRVMQGPFPLARFLRVLSRRERVQRHPSRFHRRRALFAKDGVYVAAIRESAHDGGREEGCGSALRGRVARCTDALYARIALFVSFVLVLSFVAAYVRWMLWRRHEQAYLA